MKLFVIYDDAKTASQEDLGLKMLCKELARTNPLSFRGNYSIDPKNSDIEKLLKEIKSQKEKELNASI